MGEEAKRFSREEGEERGIFYILSTPCLSLLLSLFFIFLSKSTPLYLPLPSIYPIASATHSPSSPPSLPSLPPFSYSVHLPSVPFIENSEVIPQLSLFFQNHILSNQLNYITHTPHTYLGSNANCQRNSTKYSYLPSNFSQIH